MTILVTGGAGFIGANFVLDWLHTLDEPVVNLDKLTYAGNLENLARLWHDPRHQFVRGDIGDEALVHRLLAEHKPRAILNFAPARIHTPADVQKLAAAGAHAILVGESLMREPDIAAKTRELLAA